MQKRLYLVNAIFIGLIFVSALILTRDIIAMSEPKNVTSEKAAKSQTAPHTTKILLSYDAILSRNPFGPPAGKLTQIEGTSGGGQKTPVEGELSLIGTSVGPRQYSYAIFENKNGEQEVFNLGDAVYNYGILSSIKTEKVELTQGGKKIEIPMADSTAKEVKAKGESKASPMAGFARRFGEHGYVVDQKKVLQSLENPQQILTDARLLPNIKEGKQEGFTLQEVKPGGIYDSLGLKNGDVLLRINELDISSPEKAMQALAALKGMDNVKLDITRDGKRITYTYQIR